MYQLKFTEHCLLASAGKMYAWRNAKRTAKKTIVRGTQCEAGCPSFYTLYNSYNSKLNTHQLDESHINATPVTIMLLCFACKKHSQFWH